MMRLVWMFVTLCAAVGFLSLQGTAQAASGKPYVEIEVRNQDGYPLEDAVVAFVPEKKFGMEMADLETIRRVNGERQRFTPRITVVPVGATVEFDNANSTWFRKFFIGTADPEQPKTEIIKHKEYVFETPGVAMLTSNHYDWMRGYIVAVDTPIHVMTRGNGRVRMPKLDEGKYSVLLWHPNKKNPELIIRDTRFIPQDKGHLHFVIQTSDDMKWPVNKPHQDYVRDYHYPNHFGHMRRR